MRRLFPHISLSPAVAALGLAAYNKREVAADVRTKDRMVLVALVHPAVDPDPAYTGVIAEPRRRSTCRPMPALEGFVPTSETPEFAD